MTSHIDLARPHRTLWSVRAAGLVAVVLLAGCSASVSVGGKTLDEAELEEQAAAELAEVVDVGVTPTVDCPGDLDAEVGATTECELSVEGDDTVYPVYIEVTAVDDDGTASFSVEVGEG